MQRESDIKQIEDQGLNELLVQQQIQHFHDGFPPLRLVAPAIPGSGVKVLNENEEERMVSIFEKALNSGIEVRKFVPASGAASRMFKDLFSFLDNASSNEEANMLVEKSEFLKSFFTNITKFAFYSELEALVVDKDDKLEWVNKLLSADGLGYGQKPKGQLQFHKHNSTVRTAFEEHLIEAASYCSGTNGKACVHYTVSPEHLKGFEDIFKNVQKDYQKKLGLQFEVTFSFQKKSTDTIAVDGENKPFRSHDGKLIFRPGGHGALIENLNDLDADIIFIKNIDNVVPDHLKSETKKFKKVIAGVLIYYREKIFGYLDNLSISNATISDESLHNIENFVRKELFITYTNSFENKQDKIQFLKNKLNRPIRVCGMVKNQGEPGGGPFWAVNPDQTVSLQIAEMAQIDMEDPSQKAILEQSTHFNPVDLVCCTKNFRGEKFNLLKYRDNQTGFISKKSFDGKELRALELPGLWNGAMSNWNTIFVEVPLITFNPVKTINDLLRPEHQ